MSELVAAAHRLHGSGFHVFPIDHPGRVQCIGLHGPTNPCDGQRGKHPAVKFGTWAVTVTDKTIDLAWARHGGQANVAIACGPSGIVALDEDQAGELDRWAVTYGVDLPDTYTVTTGRGRHLIYRWDHRAQKIGNSPKAMRGFKIDVRGDGGYIVAEGSQHATGAVYTGNGMPVADLPDEVAQLLLADTPRQDPPAAPDPGGTLWENVATGPGADKIGFHERHKALIAYACRLRNKGLDYEEAVPVFRERWLLCEQPTGLIPEARFHATPPSDCDYPVTWAEAEGKLRDVFGRYPAGHPEAEHQDEAEPTTWEPFDLDQWLDGTAVRPEPAVGISRTDGQKLIYPGREHTVFGETEAGKSWFALESAAVEMRMGRDVVYIHYEEGDPGSTVERLQLLSVTPEQIRRHLRFVAPARPVRGTWLAPLLDPPPALVIHDGVNEGMSLHGDDTNAADGAATFRRTIIKPFIAVGAASLTCDHVIKSSENRGRYAIGSGHKINAIDGAAFLMENVEPFGRGLRGASLVYVTKDRPGQLRAQGKATAISGKTYIGVLTVDATEDSSDFLTFWAPREGDDVAGGESTEKKRFPLTEIADMIHAIVAAEPDGTIKSRRDLFAKMRDAGNLFRDEVMRSAADMLVVSGRLAEIPGRRGGTGYKASPSASQTSDQDNPDLSASATASRTASPIGGDAVGRTRSQVRPSASDAVGRTGTQSKPTKGNR